MLSLPSPVLTRVQAVVFWVGRGDAESFFHAFYYLLAWISPFIVHKPPSLFTFYKLHVISPLAGLATVIGSSHRAGLTSLHLCWCLTFGSRPSLHALVPLPKESEGRAAMLPLLTRSVDACLCLGRVPVSFGLGRIKLWRGRRQWSSIVSLNFGITITWATSKIKSFFPVLSIHFLKIKVSMTYNAIGVSGVQRS